jgi:hypothetical protein
VWNQHNIYRIIFSFIILQQKNDSIKVENEADVLSEEDSTDKKNNYEVCMPSSALSIQRSEPEVSHAFWEVLY